MNIGGIYNASSMFQSMYTTRNSGSMASLTSSILGGSSLNSGMYSALADRSLIKSGSYGKLMSAYYDTVGEEKSKRSSSSTDILEKLKATREPAKDTADKTVTETEDGKVVEKAESTAKDKGIETKGNKKEEVDVLTDIFRRNRSISYTSMGGAIKNMAVPSFDYIV